MPNRIIKESILTSESIDALTETAEILFYRLLVTADDQGRFMVSSGYLFSALFPLVAERHVDDPKVLAEHLRKVAADCGQLAANGIIKLYSVDGRRYGYFTSWKDHQRIRNIRPKYPDPKDSNSLEVPPQSDDKNPQTAAESARNPKENPNPNLNRNPKEKEEDFSFELDVVELFDQSFPKKPHLRKPVEKSATGVTTLKQIRARRKERKWGEEPGPWVTLFNECVKSDFIMNKFASFDLQWLTEKSKMEKVERGKYKNNPATKGRNVAADELTDAEKKKFDEHSK